MKKHQYTRIILAGAIIALVSMALIVFVDQQESDAVKVETTQISEDKSASVGSLIGGLESRLAGNPEDAKGWLLLARSHDHLGDNTKAWNAYSRARKLGLTDEVLELKLAANIAVAFDD